VTAPAGAPPGPKAALAPGRTLVSGALRAAARSHGYDTGELAVSQRQNACLLRQAIYWACHELLGCSYPAIAEVLGRDHTTVLKGARRFASLAAADPGLAEVARCIAEAASEAPARHGPATPGVLVVADLDAKDLAETRRWLAANVPAARVVEV
jgi:hypothetical protein